MSGGQINSRNWTELFLQKVRGILRDGLLLSAVAVGTAAFLSGCSGLVSSANSTGNPPPTTLDVTNVQAASVTTSSSQVVWTTNVLANSSVDYGTTTAYGNSTPVDPTMVTSHQVTISGLAAGTTYYFQVNSTDSKGNHGHGGNKFNTSGFSLSGTITPTTGGNGATVALSGPASASATGDSSGNYTFAGLPNGTYTIVPSHASFMFTPASQSMVVNGANVTAANFTANAAAVAPTITTQPANQAVTAGQTATFAVVAGGTAPLSYQWQKNGASIAGATAASYTTLATTTADSGSTFAVAVTNTAGTVTSAAATLTVSAAAVAPTITTQPANQTVTAGQTATFAVVAGGTAPLSYQWQKNGANIAGATSASYTTPATATSDSGSAFAVVVTNTAGTVTSSTATLTVSAAAVAPTITTQPVNQTVTAGQTATFAVVASGTATLNYQWQKNSVNIAGATGASYTTPATTTSDSGSTFRVVVTNTAGTVTSAAATLTVSAAAVAPTITTQPVNQTVTAGQTATFAVVASGTATLNYQWQKNSVNIAGATGASYTTPATTTSDSGSTFRVVVTNTAGTVTSSAATLTVNAAATPVIQVSPINFGNDPVGTNLSQSLIIKNTGTAILTITQVTETGSAFFTASGYSLPLNVNAGQQTTITVAFLPTAAGPVSGNISIVSNAPTSPTSVALSGTGIAATLTLGISPTAGLSFGNVTTGTSSPTQNVTITNTGNSNVAISQINLTGAGYSMTGGSAPVTLSPSQNLTLTVQFSPTIAGTVNGSISIVSNATGSPAMISLSGTGVAPVQHSVDLTWNASTSTVSGYNVYRSTVSGSGYTKINSLLVTTLTYTDSTVQSATTYFYVTTAVDSSGSESANSNEVFASIP